MESPRSADEADDSCRTILAQVRPSGRLGRPALLERKLSKLIKTGRLTVKGLRREPVTVGAVVPDAPHLDVVVRIKDRCPAAWILLRPELHFAEAYMDRSLVLERGT